MDMRIMRITQNRLMFNGCVPRIARRNIVSNTPRTDADIRIVCDYDPNPLGSAGMESYEAVHAETARQLERELDEAQARLAECERELTRHRIYDELERRAAECELDALQRAAREAVIKVGSGK